MCTEYNNHFILISGESGAGKTEASKKILQFYAMTCPTTQQLQVVRDRLLLSNPVLEVRELQRGRPAEQSRFTRPGTLAGLWRRVSSQKAQTKILNALTRSAQECAGKQNSPPPKIDERDKAQIRVSFFQSLSVCLIFRHLEMPRLFATTTQAGLESTWTSSLTSR